MVQRVTTSFGTFTKPGFYYKQSVKSNPVGVAVSGNIVIIGESSGGAKYTEETLKDNSFSPDQLDRVIDKYTSGPIVDAFRALSNPSSDANITGSANRIFIVKTNGGTQATHTIANSYGSLTDKNYGTDGNKYFYQVTSVQDETGAAHEGSVIPGYDVALTGVEFAVRVQGGASIAINVFTGASTDYDTRSEVIALIDAALPAGLSCVAGTAANTIRIESDLDSLANRKGYSKAFELIDSTLGDLAALGFDAGLYTSSAEPKSQIDIKRSDINLNESFVSEAAVAFGIGYEGTTAVMTISATSLSTTVTGGSGANLSLQLSNYPTVKDLSDFINSQTGYSADVNSNSTQSSPFDLDQVIALGIASTDSDITPGKVKRSLANFETGMLNASRLDFEATATAGLPDETASVNYLVGGLRGATLAADVVGAVNICETVDINFVLPLFSRNASSDITDGLTDSGSTYTIAAINALVKNHCLKMVDPHIKKPRQGACSFWGTYSEAKDAMAQLGGGLFTLCFQKSSQVDGFGAIVSFQPWHTACIAVGMQTAGFYKNIVNKYANVISFEDPSGFDSGSPGDVDDALTAGGLFLEKDTFGNKWVSDQTTYGFDENFVYNSLQAVYTSNLVALDLNDSFQRAFIGQSLADVDASTGLSFLASKMDVYKKQKLIGTSDDAPAGYKNAKIEIQGPAIYVYVEYKLATGLYFGILDLKISQISSSASQ